MENNKLINLDFADGMLEAIMQKFKKINEMGNSVPETDQPHMQLVTDANGDKKWVERTHYKNNFYEIKLSSDNYETDEVQSVLAMLGKDIEDDLSDLQPLGSWALYWDGVAYEANIRRLPVMFTPWEDVTIHVKPGGVVNFTTLPYGEHTFAFETHAYQTKYLDEEFMPTTVPVIQSASVGQTIVVKAVDENGKPTEWESASLPSKVSDLANDAGYLTEHQDLSAKVTLPTSNGTPNHGTAGQFAVSDGNGGIMWKTLVEAEEVSY